MLSEYEEPMQNPDKLLVVLLLGSHAACFARGAQPGWHHEPLCGEPWYPLASGQGLKAVLAELDDRMHSSSQLAGFAVHLVYEQAALPWLADVATTLAAVQCMNWQVLQWEALRDRAALVTGEPPASPFPPLSWLEQGLLPTLEATFGHQESARAAAGADAGHEFAATLQALEADRAKLEAELATQRQQLAALQRPAMDDLLTYLPALYRNVFGTVSPHDLALLAGSLQVPQLPSPWPEPAPDTLQALQTRLRKLPAQRAAQLRDFCRQLPHKLELRAEMRAWLGEDG